MKLMEYAPPIHHAFYLNLIPDDDGAHDVDVF